VTDDVSDAFKDWLRAQIKEAFEEHLAAQPWWCLICGEGGNYEGLRPDRYWFPPKSHRCPPMPPPDLKGIEEVVAAHEVEVILHDPLWSLDRGVVLDHGVKITAPVAQVSGEWLREATGPFLYGVDVDL